MRVLVVEDEMMIALMVEDMLLELGHDVAKLAMRLDPALAAARNETFDFALLDINLDGEKSFPVAEVLRSRGIPFAFATGYAATMLPEPLAGAPILAKPFTGQELGNLIRRSIGIAG